MPFGFFFRFVRTFSSSTPSVPSIKVEPSNYLDVDLGVNNDEHQGDTNHEGIYFKLFATFICFSLTQIIRILRIFLFIGYVKIL
jgi:hypothetical protein